MTTPHDVIARRRAERADLLELASTYVDGLRANVEVVAAVVVGSVARGDFHGGSDVDVVVVAADLPADTAARWELVAPRRGVVQPTAWTADEWRLALRQKNPLAVDAVAHGVWLVGTPDRS